MRMINELEKQNIKMLDVYQRIKKVEFASQIDTFLVKNRISGEKFWLSTFTKDPSRLCATKWGFLLQNMVGSPGIPFLYCGGKMNESQVFLLKQPLGPTLHQLMQQTTEKRFSISTVCNIAHQVLIILENLHEKYLIINRFLLDSLRIGSGRNISLVYLGNVLHCMEYRSINKCRHIEETIEEEFSSPYMSENQLKNMKCSRRDDMFLWLITLVYFLKGTLPWLNWDHKTMVVNKTQMRQKLSHQKGIKELFQGTPKGFRKIYEHIKGLSFEQGPNYKYLKLQLDLIMAHHNKDDVLDWLKSNPKKRRVSCALLKDTLIDDRDRQSIEALLDKYGKNVELDEIQERYKQKCSILHENSKQSTKQEKTKISKYTQT